MKRKQLLGIFVNLLLGYPFKNRLCYIKFKLKIVKVIIYVPHKYIMFIIKSIYIKNLLDELKVVNSISIQQKLSN